MSIFSAMNVSSSGMTAQRVRMDIISQNIANVNTTRDANGNGYTRKLVVVSEAKPNSFSSILDRSMSMRRNDVTSGVKVTQIVEDRDSKYSKVYEPSHPDADENGYVTYSNVNTVTEMTDMIDASRAYEANITAFNAAKSMAMKGLEVGK